MTSCTGEMLFKKQVKNKSSSRTVRSAFPGSFSTAAFKSGEKTSIRIYALTNQ